MSTRLPHNHDGSPLASRASRTCPRNERQAAPFAVRLALWSSSAVRESRLRRRGVAGSGGGCDAACAAASEAAGNLYVERTARGKAA